jgi:ribosome biogenesis protein UTP30
MVVVEGMKTKEIDVDPALVQKAVQALWKVHESTQNKTNTLLPDVSKLEVRFGLVKASGREQRKPMRIPIPHGLHGDIDDLEVCLIVKEDSKPNIQEILAKAGESLKFVKKVLGLQSLRNKHAEFQQRRELFKRYDVFLADDRILPMLTKALGKHFLQSKKIPIPLKVTRETSLPFAIVDAIQASTYMTIPQGTCINIIAGNTAQNIQDMVDNVVAICQQAVHKCPRGGIANVQSIMLKLPHSVALPIYNKTPAELEELAKLAGLPSPHKHVTNENPTNEDDDGQSSKRKQPLKSPLLKALKKQKKMQEHHPNLDDTDIKDGMISKNEKTTGSKKGNDKSKSKHTKGNSVETDKLSSEDVDKKETRKEEGPKLEKKKRSKSSERTKQMETSSKNEDGSEQKDIQKKDKALHDEETNVKDQISAKRQKKGPKANENPKSKSESKKETSKPETTSSETPSSSVPKDFIPSSKYTGTKQGYVFKKDSKGLGYYRDVPPVVDRMAMEALARMATKGVGKQAKSSTKHKSFSSSSSFKGKQQQQQQQQQRLHRRASR